MRSALLDTSTTAGAVLTDEPWHPQARALLRSVAAGGLDALVAPTFPFELRSALVRAARRGRIPWERIAATIAILDRMELTVAAVRLEEGELVDACRRYGISWADAHPVLAAQRLDIPLITADARLIRALRGADMWVESILDGPTQADPGAKGG